MASDSENDPLFYTWSATCGTLSTTTGQGPVTWIAPGSPTTCAVAVSVTDSKPGHTPATKSVDITVGSCSFTLSSSSQSFEASGGMGSVAVMTQTGCSWSATSSVSWLTITSGSSGSGNGMVGFSVGTNPTTSPRQATITVQGQVFTVTQAGAGCSFTLSSSGQSFEASGGMGSVAVMTQTGCSWSATSSASWLTITSGSSGSGNGMVGFSVGTNPTTSPRQATITVQGQVFTVTQAAPPIGPGAFSLNVFGECSGSNPAIRLSWTISSNATSFEVYRNNILLVGGLSNSTGFYVDSSVNAGTTYNYFVRARNATGTTDSNSVSFTTPINCVFTLTAQPECSGTVSQIRLRWSVPPTGAGSYEVFRNGVSIFSTVNSNLTEYVNTGVSPGVTYNYFVRASTSAGLRDSTSASATALSCGTSPPGQFTLSASPECSNGVPQIRLNWTSSVGADSYQVLRNGVVLTGVDNITLTFLDTSVVNGTPYSYVVRAINSGGQTDSNQASVTASCTAPPGAFALTVTPWCSGSAPVNLLEWTGSAGRTFPYEVYRNGALVFTTDLSRYDDTAVTAGTSYGYVVRARNSVGTRDSNTVSGTAKTDCGASVAPVITSISPQSVTVGDGGFTLTVNGSNFDSTAKVLWGFAGQTPTSIITPTFINSSTLTVQVTQDTGGFSPFSFPGVLAIEVLKPGPNFWDGQRSNTVQFTVLNPLPVISFISGTCRANLNCTPSNGFDVRVFGSGFISSTTLDINGVVANKNFLGQGPVYSQMQLLVNGSLIPTPGTYTVRVCNTVTVQGTACSTWLLTVTP